MTAWPIVFLLGCAVTSPSVARAASSRVLSLVETLRLAESYSPSMGAAVENENAAHQDLRISQSFYYPTLDAVAVDSAGYPASGVSPFGFNGLTESPFRVGIAGGVYSTLTIFDLTREYGVQASRYGIQAARERARLARLDVDMKAMSLYMDAVLNRSQRDAWHGIRTEIDRLYATVKKYVRNGQYSLVTQWILRDQTEEARREEENFDLAYQEAIRRIEINTGLPPGTVDVDGIASLQAGLGELSRHRLPESPLVTSPELQAQVTQALASRQVAENWPRLLGVASAGGMDGSRLVPEQDYSAWIGLTFPIFEGFRLTAEDERARADARRAQDLSRQARLDLADSDARYERETQARTVDVARYRGERDFSRAALKLAVHRLVTFVGDLADVRDALYGYESAESGLTAAEVDLYRSKLAETIVDGGTLGGE